MEIRVAQEAVMKGDKEVRPKVFEVTTPTVMQVTSQQVDMQIARLTAELAKWTELKAAINPVVEPEAEQPIG